MPLIYITGFPGSGKTSVKEELVSRGYTAYGGAEDGLATYYDTTTGQKLNYWPLSEVRTPKWTKNHAWRFIPMTISALKSSARSQMIFVCAVTTNSNEFILEHFDKVIALSVDTDTLQKRLKTRKNSDFGKSDHEFHDVITTHKELGDDFIELNAEIVDVTKPIDQVVDEIIRITDIHII